MKKIINKGEELEDLKFGKLIKKQDFKRIRELFDVEKTIEGYFESEEYLKRFNKIVFNSKDEKEKINEILKFFVKNSYFFSLNFDEVIEFIYKYDNLNLIENFNLEKNSNQILESNFALFLFYLGKNHNSEFIENKLTKFGEKFKKIEIHFADVLLKNKDENYLKIDCIYSTGLK